MINELKIIKGAVASKNVGGSLTHVVLYPGRLQAFNGILAIDTMCDHGCDEPISVPADQLMRALTLCGEGRKISFTEKSMMVSAGTKKFRVPVVRNIARPWEVVGKRAGGQYVTKEDIEKLRTLVPFISDDAAHPWSLGVLIRNGVAYATNNIVIARAAVPSFMCTEDISIPTPALKELLRLYPTDVHNWCVVMMHDPRYVSFSFESGDSGEAVTVIRTARLAQGWPNTEALFVRHEMDGAHDIAPGLADVVAGFKTFCVDAAFPVVVIDNTGIHTDSGDSGAQCEDITLPEPVKFRVGPLSAVFRVADRVNFSKYPEPCPWSGDNIDGFIVGVV